MIQETIKHYKSINKENVLITQGATEAIFLAFTIIMKKFKAEPCSIFAFSPVYESYRELPKIFGKNFFTMDYTDDWEINSLKKLIVENKIKIFFLPSPGNPLGKIIKKDTLKALINLAKEENFFLILDYVYEDIYFEEKTYNPIYQSIPPNCIYLNSFSKSLSITGWRIGYLISEPGIVNDIKTIHDYTGLSATHPIQEAIFRYLKNSNYGEEYKKEVRAKIKKNYIYLKEKLKNLNFKIYDIEGGYFLWVGLPYCFQDDLSFSLNLLEKAKVAVVPGQHFFKDKNNFIRINMALEHKQIIEAVKRIEDFVQNNKEKNR